MPGNYEALDRQIGSRFRRKEIGSRFGRKEDIRRKLAALNRKLNTRRKLLDGAMSLAHARANPEYREAHANMLHTVGAAMKTPWSRAEVAELEKWVRAGCPEVDIDRRVQEMQGDSGRAQSRPASGPSPEPDAVAPKS